VIKWSVFGILGSAFLPKLLQSAFLYFHFKFVLFLVEKAEKLMKLTIEKTILLLKLTTPVKKLSKKFAHK
jgi:hypothetical protein